MSGKVYVIVKNNTDGCSVIAASLDRQVAAFHLKGLVRAGVEEVEVQERQLLGSRDETVQNLTHWIDVDAEGRPLDAGVMLADPEEYTAFVLARSVEDDPAVVRGFGRTPAQALRSARELLARREGL